MEEYTNFKCTQYISKINILDQKQVSINLKEMRLQIHKTIKFEILKVLSKKIPTK